MSQQTTKIELQKDSFPEAATRQKGVGVGTVLWERYEVSAVLGTGDLGELFRCYDRDERRNVCLRQLPPALRRSKQVLAAIHAGIRRISEESHPNVASIRQLVYIGEEIFLLGDFAPGIKLGEWAAKGEGGRRTLEEVLPILRQVASALDFAHEKEVVHRNLKPSNVYLDGDGVARVTDFGLAPHRHMTLVRGEAVRSSSTGSYLAPELAKKAEPDAASDQYSLGALAWELLAGAAPGEGQLPEGLPATTAAAIRRALAAQPRKRFASCGDFVKALGGEKVGGARGRSAAEKRKMGLVAGAVAAGVLVVAGLGYGGLALSAWLAQPGEPSTEEAQVVAAASEPAAVVEASREWVAPTPVVATTPLPKAGFPWVAQSAAMEFVWVSSMQAWVGRYEVTNEEYRRKDSSHDSGEIDGVKLNAPRQPVVRINYDDTVAYAAWLTEQERAAAPAKPFIEGYQDGFATTAPVERSVENAFGLFGTGGNVWETTTREPGSPQFGGWQGGGWEDNLPARLRSDALYGFIGNARGAVNGFRLILAPVESEAPAAAAPASAS